MIVKDPNGKGNDNYEGFMIELLQKISEKAKFTYRITLAPDGKYGAEETRGQWTGMIGEVMKQVEYYDSVFMCRHGCLDRSINTCMDTHEYTYAHRKNAKIFAYIQT